MILIRLLAMLMVLGSSAAAMEPGGITADEWTAYKQQFLRSEGRIVDNGNGGISHSEGQGYGLLIAYLAKSPADFERIWHFTRTEMLLRDDGLVAWKWEEKASPHVTDVNNATDGDILIAYALGLAGAEWARPDYVEAARGLADSLLKVAAVRDQDRLLLLPGAVGFSRTDREDGPVVNLSYWIYEAFPVLDRLRPGPEWARLAADGRALLGQSLFSTSHLPPDWISVRRGPRPAKGFPFQFGYNAVRIPLYLMRAGVEDENLLRTLRDGMASGGGIGVVDLAGGIVREQLGDPGYRIIQAAASCILDRTPIDKALLTFQPVLYYPSTLHLLMLSYLRKEAPECL